MAAGAGVRAREGIGVMLAGDPGLLRLRLALRGVVGAALAAAVCHRLGPAVGVPGIVAMLLAGVVGLVGAFASSGRGPRDAAVTLAAFPILTTVATVLAAASHGHSAWQEVGYVVVMVGAVFARRIGQRSFVYGMLVFQTYLFVAFSGFGLAAVPGVVAVQVTAAACAVLAAAVLVPDQAASTLAAARWAFTARVEALAHTGADVVEGRVEHERAAARLHARSLRLVEAALLVDGYLAVAPHPGRHVPGTTQSPAAVRAGLVHAELAAAELASSLTRLHGGADLSPAARLGLAGALRALSNGDQLYARSRAQRVLAVLDDRRGEETTESNARARDAVVALETLLDVMAAGTPEIPDHVERVDIEPAVALMQGHLPGSAASVGEAITAGGSWWSGRSLNTRLCVQSALAGTLALLAGHAVSPTRWYWSMLACFLVLTGTFTTGETTAKGVNRVAGTVVGLLAAVFAVQLTGDRPAGVVAVMVICGGIGLYFFRVTYAVMAFAVTTIMGLLYEVLQEFSDELLGLRLLETIIGATVAVVVSLLVLPVRTRDARAAAERSFLAALEALLADVRDRLADPERRSNLYLDARRLDAALLQLALVGRPAGGPTLVGLSSRSAARSVRRWTEVAYRARTLVVAVARTEPGSRPDLAERVQALRAGKSVPVTSGDELSAVLGDLERAVEVVRPTASREPAAVTARR